MDNRAIGAGADNLNVRAIGTNRSCLVVNPGWQHNFTTVEVPFGTVHRQRPQSLIDAYANIRGATICVAIDINNAIADLRIDGACLQFVEAVSSERTNSGDVLPLNCIERGVSDSTLA